MEYDHHMVQDFDEDLGLAQNYPQTSPKKVPTFYADVYTTHEELNFQNRSRPQRSPPKIEFTGAQPIEIKRAAAPPQMFPNPVPRKAKAKSKGRKKPLTGRPIKKKPHVSKPTVTKKTIKAYTSGPISTQEPVKENQGWNFDTKTPGYFDKSLRRQIISHPIRDSNRLTEAEDAATESWILRPNVNQEERRKKSRSPSKYGLEPRKKDYFTDLDDFTQHIVSGDVNGGQETVHSRARGGEERPKTSKGPNRSQEFNRQRTRSNPQIKKQVHLEDVVEKIMQKQEDKEGKPNPFFARRAREIIEKNRNNPFFVSMSVPREQIYQPLPKAQKNTTVSTQPKYLDYQYEQQEQVKRSPVREQPALREIDRTERIQEQERIYRGKQGDYQEPEELDVYPSRDDGGRNMGFSNQKMRSAVNKININRGEAAESRFAQVARDIHKKYIDDDLKRHHHKEIERRVELDNAMGEYKTKLEERAVDPNRHFEKISRGLASLRKDFNAVSQDLELTNNFMKKGMKSQKGSETILARGAGKIIKLYSDQLTELLLDDMIVELIPILHEKEEGEKRRNRKTRKKDILNDCLEALKDFTFEQKKVVDKAEEIYTMTTMTRNRMKELDSGYPGSRPLAKVLKKRVELTGPFINIVKEHVTEQKQFRETTDIFSGRNNIMMDFIVKSMMDDLTREAVNNFIEAQNEFVDRVLVNEFDF